MKMRLFLTLMVTITLSLGCQQGNKAKAENKPAAKKSEQAEAEKPAEPAAEKPAEPATEKPAEPATEKPTELAAEAETPSTSREGGAASLSAAEKPAEPAAEKPAEPAAEKPAEPAAEKPAEPAAEKPAEPAAEKPEEAATKSGNPVVIIETTMGTFKVELYPSKTPVTVANFLRYVDDSFYTGAIFHRVVRGFVIQTGGFDPDYGRRLTREPIVNEAATGLPNERGTIAMARTQQRNSGSSQFYVNLRNNEMLNYRGESRSDWGYCAFGRVIEGMDVVDKIGEIETGSGGPLRQDVPKTPVSLVSVRRAE